MTNRASTLKRERRTNDRMTLLDDQIIAMLAEDHPQSVRHLSYRMTDPRLAEPVEKSDRGYRHMQDHRCVKLLRSGCIPYGWIADLSRRGYCVNTYDSAAEFLRTMSGYYRGNLWRDAESRCEVWAQSRSIAFVLLKDCNELAVALYPCGGFSSLSFVHAPAELHNGLGDDPPLVVLYIGDFDPAGVLIDKALERELPEDLEPNMKLLFQRIAIKEDQVQEFDLPTKPRKVSDKRSQHVTYTAEAEAMPAADLRAILRVEVEALLPEGALDATPVAEETERAYINQMTALLPGGQR